MSKKKATPPPPPKKERNRAGVNNSVFEEPEAIFQPPKIVLVGVEGWGKTSLVANIPNVALLMPETETGYKTLFGIGRVPKVPCKVTKTWKETLEALDSLDGFEALALDELSGFEAQCFEHVCRKEYGNDWNKFNSYGRGYKVAAPEWRVFLAKLEALNMMIFALSHCAIETFKDPMADDHDRYVAALYKGTWGATRRWADACLFGTFEAIIDDDGKGIGGTDRVLFTEHRDTHDAKNRYGMEPEYEMPDNPDETWSFLWSAINGELVDEEEE